MTTRPHHRSQHTNTTFFLHSLLKRQRQKRRIDPCVGARASRGRTTQTPRGPASAHVPFQFPCPRTNSVRCAVGARMCGHLSSVLMPAGATTQPRRNYTRRLGRQLEDCTRPASNPTQTARPLRRSSCPIPVQAVPAPRPRLPATCAPIAHARGYNLVPCQVNLRGRKRRLPRHPPQTSPCR